MELLVKAGDTMIVALPNDSVTVLDDLVRQFGAGELSYDELWKEIEDSFCQPADSAISDVPVGSGI